MTSKVGILGSGDVGQTLARGFVDLGYDVQIGSREGKIIDGWAGGVGTFADVAQAAEIVVLAVKGMIAEELVTSLATSLAGKTVIDTTNPIANTAPEDGVLHYFTSFDNSLMERLQLVAPDAHFVKAFSSVGSPNMVKPDFGGILPTMFICGNNAEAKQSVREILTAFGWETEDLGTVTAARAIEPLCITWCTPGFLSGDWNYAFKLLRK